MSSVRRLQPVIQERVDVLMARLKGFRGTGEVVMVSWAFAAFTHGELGGSSRGDRRKILTLLDIVMMYCFGRCDRRLG